ncbi:hypothetical protein N9Z72_01825 [Akkermansiaceae bacterium]|nr:hypothetical protein [Akkermansiaceae bacterium]
MTKSHEGPGQVTSHHLAARLENDTFLSLAIRTMTVTNVDKRTKIEAIGFPNASK